MQGLSWPKSHFASATHRARPCCGVSWDEKKSRPASELAMLANVSPQTASNHLKTLVNARLLKVSPMGRNKFYRLSDASVAAALESLMVVARPEIKAGGIAERTAPWPKGAHPKEAAVEEKRVATTDLWFKSLGRT